MPFLAHQVDMSEINSKIFLATKWSAFTELLSKLVTPISCMVLARVLTPSAFGVITTLNMVITFAEVFTDAGFQRYLIQKEFSSIKERNNETTVAFWSNFILSLVIWAIIILFKDPLAELVGSPNLGAPLAIACVAIPLASFSSIQLSLFKKDFDFKTLFYVRIVSICIPLVITIPLALIYRSFWALLIGNIAKCLADAIILTLKSSWRPTFYFNFTTLKNMASYCLWSLTDSVLIWMTGYVDIFFIGVQLNAYYLGLYKTSITTIGQITSIITAIVVPVLEPTFATLKNDLLQLKQTLFKMQKYLGVLLLPLGAGIFVYSDLVTNILLGDQWLEASEFIGLWAIIEVITILICRFISNIFPSIGRPKVSVICQLLYLAILIPGVYISVRHRFEALYYTRALIRIVFCIVYLFAGYFVIKLSATKMIFNILPEICASIAMSIIGSLLRPLSDSIIWQITSIFICALFYFACIYLLPNERIYLANIVRRVTKRA
jgi:PST family polysaccharide transporter